MHLVGDLSCVSVATQSIYPVSIMLQSQYSSAGSTADWLATALRSTVANGSLMPLTLVHRMCCSTSCKVLEQLSL
jgi:hypothetical protein